MAAVAPYLAAFSARFQLVLQYRAAALAGFATQCWWGAIKIMVLAAFFYGAHRAQPMTLAARHHLHLARAGLPHLPALERRPGCRRDGAHRRRRLRPPPARRHLWLVVRARRGLERCPGGAKGGADVHRRRRADAAAWPRRLEPEAACRARSGDPVQPLDDRGRPAVRLDRALDQRGRGGQHDRSRRQPADRALLQPALRQHRAARLLPGLEQARPSPATVRRPGRHPVPNLFRRPDRLGGGRRHRAAARLDAGACRSPAAGRWAARCAACRCRGAEEWTPCASTPAMRAPRSAARCSIRPRS